jgi:small subunit ribosomal protein S15
VGLSQEKKREIVENFRVHEKDVGSAEVQTAFLTKRIEDLTPHLERAANDHSSRRGLLKMVGKRKRLLAYLRRSNPEGHRRIIEKLELRK